MFARKPNCVKTESTINGLMANSSAWGKQFLKSWFFAIIQIHNILTKRFGSKPEELNTLATIIATTAIKGINSEYFFITLELLVKTKRALIVLQLFTIGVSIDSLRKKSNTGGNVTNKTV
jgi:hypothetical protein